MSRNTPVNGRRVPTLMELLCRRKIQSLNIHVNDSSVSGRDKCSETSEGSVLKNGQRGRGLFQPGG